MLRVPVMPDGRTVASRVPLVTDPPYILPGVGTLSTLRLNSPLNEPDVGSLAVSSSTTLGGPLKSIAPVKFPYVGASVEVVWQYADVEVMPCHEYPDGTCSRWPRPEF
jgi:hypothetical protein